MKICFISLAAWSFLSNEVDAKPTVGGAELQVVILARELVRRGHQVSIIVMDYGQPEEVEIDGIRVLAAHRPVAGLPVIRFVYPRLTKLWSALRRASAEVYFQSGAGALTGIVAAYTKVNPSARFVFWGASNADFDPKLPFVRFGRDRALFRWGIRQARLIFVQTQIQQDALFDWLVLPSMKLPNALDAVDSVLENTGHVADKVAPFVLWAGRLVELKRPDRYLKLARSLPHINFLLVGASAIELSLWLEKNNQPAELPLNLYAMGLIPMAKVDGFFARAALLVNTSDVEGFPNTFIQAWRYAVPTVSFFDAGQVVGKIVRDDREMSVVVSELMGSEKNRQSEGQRCLECFTKHHSLERVVDRLEIDLEEAFS